MLVLNLDGEIILLKPCPFYFFRQYNFYFGLLEGLAIGDIAASEQHWAIFQRLINLHPRADIEESGFVLPDGIWQLDGLIEGLKDLNRIETLPQREKPKSYLEFPVQSSGDEGIDVLTDLSGLFGYDAAIAMTKTMGLNEINKVIGRHNEINRPKEDRANELMQKDLKHWMNEDPDDWFDSLGIPTE